MTASEAGVKSGRSPLRPDQLDPDQAPSHLARLLLQYRKAHDLTQTNLANRIGCTRNYLSMLKTAFEASILRCGCSEPSHQ